MRWRRLFFGFSLNAFAARIAAFQNVAISRRTSSRIRNPQLDNYSYFPATTLNTDHKTYTHSNLSTGTDLCGKRGSGKVEKKRISKSNLPEKICVVCDRPFTWRKKWQRDWDKITCCSKACNAKRRSSPEMYVKGGWMASHSISAFAFHVEKDVAADCAFGYVE